MPEKNLLHCPKCNNEFPAQGRGRYVQIVDVFRDNQVRVIELLCLLHEGKYDIAKECLSYMHKQDRTALLQPNGILTKKQLRALEGVHGNTYQIRSSY